jgi:hypothetical protein
MADQRRPGHHRIPRGNKYSVFLERVVTKFSNGTILSD